MFLLPTLVTGAVLAYLVGSIPFGVVITKILRLPDVRTLGSGNIGATNVLRTGHKTAAAATLLLDMAKGSAVIIAAPWVLQAIYGSLVAFGNLNEPELLADMIEPKKMNGIIFGLGVCALLGHLYPVWLRFKGGKGVATYFGVLLAFNTLVGVFALALWLATAAVTRLSSLAALVAVAGGAITLCSTQYIYWQFLLGGVDTPYYLTLLVPSWLVLAAAGLVIGRHDGNIRRLIAGTEPKIGEKAV